MKTPEDALTQWVGDDIIFNYVDGRGPQHHNRDQFVKVCNVLRAGNENAAPEDVTSQTQATITSGMMGLCLCWVSCLGRATTHPVS